MSDRQRVAVTYCRQSVSNADDGRDSISVAAQLQRITDSAARSDLTIAASFEDVDVRGHTVQREGLDALLARVEQGGIDAVVVYDVSRLARDTELFVSLLNRLKRNGVELISIREPAGERWMQVLFSALSERDRDLLSVRITDAMRERAKLGQYIGQVPIGYTREPVDGPNGRIIRKLKPDGHAPLVADLFARYEQGASLADLVRWLNEPGRPRPKWARTWSGTTVRTILMNPAYVGDVVIRETKRSPGIVVTDAHEALVPREQWERVQSRLAALGGRTVPRMRRTGRHWLEGRVFCACGAPMYLMIHRHSVRGDLLKRWSCRSAHAIRKGHPAPVCPYQRSVVGNRRVEPHVVTRLEQDLARIAEVAPTRLVAAVDRPDAAREALQRRIVEIQRDRRGLAVGIARANDPTYLIEEDNALAAEERAITTRLATIVPLITIDALTAARQWAAETATLVRTAYAARDEERLRACATTMGLRVMVNGDTYALTLTYDQVFQRLV